MDMTKEERFALAEKLDALSEFLPLDAMDIIEQAIRIISPQYDEYCEKLLEEIEDMAENY